MRSEVSHLSFDAISELSDTRALIAHPVPARKQADPADKSDEDLLLEVHQGSKESLGTLFRRHAQVVFRIAYRVLQDHSEADDCRQEVFLYLFERAHLFDPRRGAAVSWIAQVTYHRAIDRRRRLASRKHYTSEEFDEQRFSGTNDQPGINLLTGAEMLEEMESKLTVDQFQTMELHFFEGYTFREIAQKKGQSLGNIRHHYYRALEQLRSHLFAQNRD